MMMAREVKKKIVCEEIGTMTYTGSKIYRHSEDKPIKK